MKRFGCPDMMSRRLAEFELAEAVAEIERLDKTYTCARPTYLPYSAFERIVSYLVTCALPIARYNSFIRYDEEEWESTRVNIGVEAIAFEGDRAREVVCALQAIAPYPSRAKVDRDQVVAALATCDVFPDYKREMHEAAAAAQGRVDELT
jgi:hypothetical protein